MFVLVFLINYQYGARGSSPSCSLKKSLCWLKRELVGKLGGKVKGRAILSFCTNIFLFSIFWPFNPLRFNGVITRGKQTLHFKIRKAK
jgi:hypothetical protein